jgi:hypothetical protein
MQLAIADLNTNSLSKQYFVSLLSMSPPTVSPMISPMIRMIFPIMIVVIKIPIPILYPVIPVDVHVIVAFQIFVFLRIAP